MKGVRTDCVSNTFDERSVSGSPGTVHAGPAEARP